MTVPALPSRNDYTGDGSLATYDYNFRITSATDLLVVVRNLANVETTLTHPADYSVTGIGDFDGGSITLTAGNLAIGFALTIRDNPALVQTTDIRNQGNFFPEIHEDAFDYAMRAIKSLQDQISRSLVTAETVTLIDNRLPPPSPGEALHVKDDGTGFEWKEITAVNVPVSTFMQPILNLANAVAVLAALDAAKATDGTMLRPVIDAAVFRGHRESTLNLAGFGAVTVNAAVTNYFVWVLTGNVTSVTINNVSTIWATALTFEIVQSGSGSYTIAWPAGIKWEGGVAPELTTTVGKRDVITLLARDGQYMGFVAGKNF